MEHVKSINKVNHSNDNGFTLVELVIVIAIIGILSAAAVPRALQYVDKAKIASDTQAANVYEGALEILVASGDISITSGSALATTSGPSLYITNADVAPPATLESLDIFNQYTDKINISNKSGTVSLDIYFKNIEDIRDRAGYPISPEDFGELFQDNAKLSALKYYHGIVIELERKGVSGNLLIEK